MGFASTIALEGESNVQGRINKDGMTENVPGRVEVLGDTFIDSDWAYFSEGTELGAAARSTLEPDKEWNSIGRSHDIMPHGSEQIVKHATGAFGVIPIDLLITGVSLEMK